MELDAIRSVLSSSIDPTLETTDYRLASVLVVIYGQKPIVIMTEKPKHMKFHAGEISFPGGKLDPNDSDLLETALRETREEIGLKITEGPSHRTTKTSCNLEFRIYDIAFCCSN